MEMYKRTERTDRQPQEAPLKDREQREDQPEILCRLSGITLWYAPDRLLFDHLDLTIRRGERLLVTGCAGSGRTSLIRLLSGEQTPDEGCVICRGRVAVIRAQTGLMASMDLQQHVALPLLCRGVSVRESMARAGQLLETLGEGRRRHLKPVQMSPCDRALIAVGQAALQDADIIAADTFMDALSDKERQRILRMLFDITEGRSCLLMTDRPLPGWDFDRYIELSS